MPLHHLPDWEKVMAWAGAGGQSPRGRKGGRGAVDSMDSVEAEMGAGGS